MSTPEKVRGLLSLMRPLNSSVAATAVVFALFLATRETLPALVYLGSAGAAFFTTAHSMVHNDIVDIEVDKINAPSRPLPSGLLSPMVVKIWAISLLIVACGFGLVIDLTIGTLPFSVLWALGNATILDLYNLYFKKTGLLGNFFVAWPPYALFLYADLLINRGLTPGLQSIGLIGLFSIFGRETIKGIYDIEGDAAHGVRTIAVVHGRDTAAKVGGAIVLLAVPSSIPLILLTLNELVIPILLLIFDIILVYKILTLIRSPTDENAYSTKLQIMQLMLVFLLVLAINEIVVRSGMG